MSAKPSEPDDKDATPVVTPKIAARAALWIARLHGPDRSKEMERECLEWLARSPAHRYAFERCTETWLAVAAITNHREPD